VVGRRFMKMEIDMAKEIEKMRIETEVKCNELKLESQKDRSWDLVNNLVPRNGKNIISEKGIDPNKPGSKLDSKTNRTCIWIVPIFEF
nr:hypothetical protein [Tanacetum cinerariifolium]